MNQSHSLNHNKHSAFSSSSYSSCQLQLNQSAGVPPYLRVIRPKTYRGYVKRRIILNVIYNVIFVCINTVKFN
jgi:hypothetical protein